MSRPLNVYFAARYSLHPQMRLYAEQLERLGYKVTSRWIYGGHDTVDANHDEDKQRYAEEDLEDLLLADIIVSFTEDPSTQVPGRARGGRHVEFGIAIGMNHYVSNFKVIDTVVIGYRENAFHWLPDVEFYPTWEEYLTVAAQQQKERTHNVY